MPERDGVTEEIPEGIEIVPGRLVGRPQGVFVGAVGWNQVAEIKTGVEHGKASLVGGAISRHLYFAEHVAVPFVARGLGGGVDVPVRKFCRLERACFLAGDEGDADPGLNGHRRRGVPRKEGSDTVAQRSGAR